MQPCVDMIEMRYLQCLIVGLTNLRDLRAAERIISRIAHVRFGQMGEVKVISGIGNFVLTMAQGNECFCPAKIGDHNFAVQR